MTINDFQGLGKSELGEWKTHYAKEMVIGENPVIRKEAEVLYFGIIDLIREIDSKESQQVAEVKITEKKAKRSPKLVQEIEPDINEDDVVEKQRDLAWRIHTEQSSQEMR